MIDDFFGDWNDHKVLGLGTSLLRNSEIYYLFIIYVTSGMSLKTKLATALAATALHSEQFHEFSCRFSEAVIKTWESMVSAWEVDDSKPNPYIIMASCKCVAVRQVGCKLTPANS
jgi:hypothetical protein